MSSTFSNEGSIAERLEQLFDLPILSHGFAPYQRDYVLVAEIGGESPLRGRWYFTFTHCPVANLTTAVGDSSWHASWGDEFTDYARWEAAGEPDGYVWGVNWSMAYPGPSYIENSALAAEWSARFARTMHEARIETNAFQLHLVFHDLRVDRAGDEVSVYDQVTIPLR